MLAKKCDRDNKDQVIAALGNIIIYVEANWFVLDLSDVRDRTVEQLSGGELQRFAIALCCVQSADVYVTFSSNFDCHIDTCLTNRQAISMWNNV
jgi:translation initiation factor RLI1